MGSLVREGIRYISINYISIFLNAIRGILLVFILSPASLGVYRLIFTYISYFRYSNLGLNALAFYRAPVKGMQEVYASLIIKANKILALVFGAIFTAGFAFLWDESTYPLSIGIIVSLFSILVFTQIGETHLTVSRFTKNFNLVNRYNVLLSSGSVILSLALGSLWELEGVLFGLLAATLFSSLFISHSLKSTINPHVQFSFYRTKVLLKNSTQTIMPGLLMVLFTSIEVWIITYKYGVEETGFYSVVLAIINLLMVINSDGAIFLYAKRSSALRSDKRFLLKSTMSAFIIIAILSTLLLIPVRYGVLYLFPEYAGSADIYQVCFWGIPFLVSKNFALYYISNNRTNGIIAFLLILLLVKVILLLAISTPEQFYIAVALSNVMFGLSFLFVFASSLLGKKKES